MVRFEKTSAPMVAKTTLAEALRRRAMAMIKSDAITNSHKFASMARGRTMVRLAKATASMAFAK